MLQLIQLIMNIDIFVGLLLELAFFDLDLAIFLLEDLLGIYCSLKLLRLDI